MIAAVLFSLLAVLPADSNQVATPSDPSRRRALLTLDSYIVTRYRGAQLLPDSLQNDSANAVASTVPRVESVRDARGDTLIGVHFDSRPSAPALQPAGTVRFAVPSGLLTNTTGRILTRRRFRAPRTPDARTDDQSSWRYGWAYLVVLPRQRSPLPALAPRGWIMIDGASPEPKDRRTRP